MAVLKNVLLVGLFIFIALGILYPNPFGNNPDIILDESYFLTSALSAIEHRTLPGWDFPASGTFYGGPQTYIDTLVLVPVIGTVLAASDFSVMAAKLWVAQNTGELTHVLRIVNGLLALLAIVCCFVLLRKKKAPLPLALTLTLFLFLLLGNAVAIGLLHTAKMWALYTVFVAVMSAIFIAQEYYLAHLGKPFMEKDRYVALFVWAGVLTFFQSYFGVFSVALLTLYALLLGHMSIRDVWRYALRRWYLLVLFALTQISFLYQAYRISEYFTDSSTKTAAGGIDWLTRLSQPVIYTTLSQPLTLLYVVGIVVVVFLAFRSRASFIHTRGRMWIAIAVLHPLLTYLFFHVGIGFDIGPRYAIILGIACAFSAAILLAEIGRYALRVSLLLSGILFVVVNVHAIQLYWQASSETVLVRTIFTQLNSPDNVFLTDHSARRMTLPVNAASLSFLNERRADMGRFRFLLDNREQIPESPFKPIAITAYSAEEEAEYLAEFATSTRSIWMIRRLCTERCTATETEAGTCFEINMNACDREAQEPNTLPDFLSTTQLGYSYVVRKVR